MKKNGKSKVSQTIEILEILPKNGVDINEVIKETGVNPEEKISQDYKNMMSAYKGKGTCVITEEEKEEAQKLGLKEVRNKRIIQPKKCNSDNSTISSKIIEIADILYKNGVKLNEIQLSKRINGRQVFIKINEIKQPGIDINKIIEENGLDGELKIGEYISMIRNVCNNKLSRPITEQDREKAIEIGIVKENKNLRVDKVIEIAEILAENGVKFEKMQLSKIVNERQMYLKIREINQPGVDIDKIIVENRIRRRYSYWKITSRIKRII